VALVAALSVRSKLALKVGDSLRIEHRRRSRSQCQCAKSGRDRPVDKFLAEFGLAVAQLLLVGFVDALDSSDLLLEAGLSLRDSLGRERASFTLECLDALLEHLPACHRDASASRRTSPWLGPHDPALRRLLDEPDQVDQRDQRSVRCRALLGPPSTRPKPMVNAPKELHRRE